MIRKADEKNFNALMKACDDGRVALMEVQRVSDDKIVSAICTLSGPGEDGNLTLTPFAIMVEGNPFELFRPPSEDGTGFEQEEKPDTPKSTEGL
jgi:uncharacterized protein DUF6117